MITILIILAAVLLAFAVYLCLGTDNRLQTVCYTVTTDKVSASVRLAVVTDLHSCQYGEGQTELLAAIEAQKPDAVLLVGDIYDDKLPEEQADLFLQAAGKRFRCYYIPGNHELRRFSGDCMDLLLERVSSYGITVLCGKCETVTWNGSTLNICGLTEQTEKTRYIRLPSEVDNSETAELSALAEAADNGCFTVLMAHRPSKIRQYLSQDFDLIVAGHAHGGQWRIPGILNGLIAPDEGLFPKYAGGRYDFDHAAMIVSRGLSRKHKFIPRIFNPPELVIVDIAPSCDK